MGTPHTRRPWAFALPGKHALKTRITAATLAIFLASLWALSSYASYMVRRDMERALGEQQYSTVAVVAAQINAALLERREALEIASGSIAPTLQRNTQATQSMLEMHPLLTHLFNGGVVVMRADGTTVAEAPIHADRIGINYAYIPAVANALKDGKATISHPLVGPKLHAPVFGITVPLRNAQGMVIGALSGVTNLGLPSFLDEVTQSNYGKTGGYMIVARQPRQVVTATDKRRNMEVLPGNGINPLIDRFVQGYEGSGVVVNPQGVKVLASAKGIPVADWYVAAALPAQEAFAPIHDAQRQVLLATLLLTLVAGGLTWWLIKRQLAPMEEATAALAAMTNQQAPPRALAVSGQDEIASLITSFNRLLCMLQSRDEALRQSEYQLSEISENVDAFIYLKDTEGRHLFANRPMRELMGVSRDGVVGLTDDAIFDAETAAQLRHNDLRVFQEGKPLRMDEANLRLRNGKTFTTLTIKIPLHDGHGKIYGLCGISTDITERKQAEEALRIAAIAFECQEGIIVMDAGFRVLRVNHAFSQITGYTAAEAQQAITAFFVSNRNPATANPGFWNEAQRLGAWKGEVRFQRKHGEYYTALVTVTAVMDAAGHVSHYVCNFVDNTNSHLLEQQRLANEAAQRNALVREVHHRIKNNLQGITGLLRQFAQNRPETADPINQAIGQVQSVSVIHGLQGRAEALSVRLCELTSEIAAEIQALWGTRVEVDIPPGWKYCTVEEKEAVPMALVLHELILNAVKHGEGEDRTVRITIRAGEERDEVRISIINRGRFQEPTLPAPAGHSGLQLIAVLMPREGVSVVRNQREDSVVTVIEVKPPVIFREQN